MKIKYWIKAARLRTLPLALSCILMGASLAIINNYKIQPKVLFLAFVTTVLLQVLSNFANDYGDGVKGSDINRKKSDRMVQSGKITSKQMLFGIIMISITTLITGILLLTFVFSSNEIWLFLFFLLLGLLSIMAAIKYTVGKGAYGYKGFGDVFVFIFFGIVGVLGSYYLFTQTFSWLTILGSMFTGLLSCGVLNMNNIRDYKNDQTSKKNTLVVYMGLKKAKTYQKLLITVAIISFFTIIAIANNSILWITCLPIILLIRHLFFVNNNKELEKFDSQLKIIALSCFASCLLLLIFSMLI